MLCRAILLLLLLLLPGLAALSGEPQASLPSRCRILLTNDDGINAPGLLAAYKHLSKLCETVISAPAKDESGASHAIFNTRGGVTVRGVNLGNGIVGYAVEGSPAEAVVVGIFALGNRQKFDLVVSGVNPGENLGLGNLYSGTVNAAMEGALRGTPSIAVSQSSSYGPDYERSAALARNLAERVLRHGLPSDTILNVNVPHGRIRGVKVLGSGLLSMELRGFDAAPAGRDVTVYTPRLAPRQVVDEPGDVREYRAGYITIVPLALDRTATSAISAVRTWTKNLALCLEDVEAACSGDP